MAPRCRVPLTAEEPARDGGAADLLPYRSGSAIDHKTPGGSLRFCLAGGGASGGWMTLRGLCLTRGLPEIGQHRPSGVWYFPVASSTGVLAGQRKAMPRCLGAAPWESEPEPS